MRARPGETCYSEETKGVRGNYEWPASFDLTDGFVGICQKQDDGLARVLLSPDQVRALVAFLREKAPRKLALLGEEAK